MRGEVDQQPTMFSYVDLESRIPKHHPIRKIRRIVDKALPALEAAFSQMYSDKGRPSIPPEQLIRALLLQIFFTIRSERQLMERIDYDLLFRWFVGLSMDDTVWNHSVFSKNRDRLMSYEWPGNVRELRNTLKAAYVEAGPGNRITSDMLPKRFGAAKPHKTAYRLPANTLMKELSRHGGDVSATARALGVSRMTVYRRLEEFGIDLSKTRER